MTEPPNIRTHIEDVEDVIIAIGKSFNLQFAPDELGHVSTFKELCDAITAKIELQDADDCTTQQAFYKLREAIVEVTGTEKSAITVDTELASIFPREGRRGLVKQLEASLGFRVHILFPKFFILVLLIVALFVSACWIRINPLTGIIGLTTSILLLILVVKLGKEFTEKTVGELAEKMTRARALVRRLPWVTQESPRVRGDSRFMSLN